MSRPGRFFKAVERWGRRRLFWLLARLWPRRRAAVQLGHVRPPKILVVRLDARLGNLLLTTPLLLTLARRYPGCQIDCVVSAPNAALLVGLPFLRRVYGFAKWDLLGARGMVSLWRQLRRQRYDLCLDAANPSHPSLTQALLVRGVAAAHSIGYDRFGLGRLYSAPVHWPRAHDGNTHEIDHRLALLAPLGAGPRLRTMAVAPPWPPPTPGVAHWLEQLGQLAYVVINLGARLAKKRLQPADYAMVANVCTSLGLKPVLAWGPAERPLLAPVLRLAADAIAAPPTTLRDLACLLRGAEAVISADTGPMHLAVALGRPTCGVFVHTEAGRYGHPQPPHLVVDLTQPARGSLQAPAGNGVDLRLVAAVRSFLAARRPAPRPVSSAAAARQVQQIRAARAARDAAGAAAPGAAKAGAPARPKGGRGDRPAQPEERRPPR